MDWQEAIELAKIQLGISGWTNDWNEVVDTARDILSEDASKQARAKHLVYLKSDAWKFLREKILIRDDYKCQDCIKALLIVIKLFNKFDLTNINYTPRASEVYHLDYQFLHTAKEPEFCICLCNICHKLRHSKGDTNYSKELLKKREEKLIYGIYLLLLKQPEAIQEMNNQHDSFLKSITICYKKFKEEDINGTNNP